MDTELTKAEMLEEYGRMARGWAALKERAEKAEVVLRELLALAKEGSKSDLVKRGNYIAFQVRLGDAMEAAEKVLGINTPPWKNQYQKETDQ